MIQLASKISIYTNSLLLMKYCNYVHYSLVVTLQKQSCCVSKVFGYYNYMTILTMKFYECRARNETPER